jgi:hypothetical protein
MRIACLAWGSLVWQSKELPLKSEWFNDGPDIRVEYLRQSNNKRMTLVLETTALPVPSLWALIDCETLIDAVASLGTREGVPKKNWDKHIGTWSIETQSPCCIENLPAWAESNDIEHVVWTALPPKFDVIDAPNKIAKPEQVVAYLSALSGDDRARAEEYVRKTPSQIKTAYRRAIEEQLHWTCDAA